MREGAKVPPKRGSGNRILAEDPEEDRAPEPGGRVGERPGLQKTAAVAASGSVLGAQNRYKHADPRSLFPT